MPNEGAIHRHFAQSGAIKAIRAGVTVLDTVIMLIVLLFVRFGFCAFSRMRP